MASYEHPLIRKGTMQPRLYQESILSTAASKNTLCVLPTGLGKTNIAIMLTAHRLERFPDSKVLVLAPTRPLAAQHMESFLRFMELDRDDLSLLTGAVPPADREIAYMEKRVILATPQTVQNDLREDRLSLRDFSLLILDEIHRAVGRYAYPFISGAYMEQAKNPRILGLTASPGGSRQKIEEIASNSHIEAVEIRTEEDPDVAPYVKEKDIEWVQVELPQSFLKVRKLLSDALSTRMSSLRRMRLIRGTRASKRQLLELQNRMAGSIRQGNKKAFTGMRLAVQSIKIEHALEQIETQGISSAEKYFSKLRGEETKSTQSLLKDKNVSNAMFLVNELYEKGSRHPKMSKICSIVSQQLSHKPHSRIIIFANYRNTVSEIESVLSGLEGARPAVLIGQKEGLSQKEQVNIIREFGDGEYNVLITTSIGEEGLSIESADMAIFYESVASEIRQIQRRGRVGRTKIGKVIVLIASGTRDEAYRWVAHNKEKEMRRTLNRMRSGGPF